MGKPILICLLVLLISAGAQADIVRLESHSLRVEVDDATGRWALLDKRSGTKWPSEGMANPGTATWLEGNFQKIQTMDKNSVRLHQKNGTAVVFTLLEEGNALELRYEGKADGSVRVLGDALAITDIEGGYAIVPSREGLLIPANSGKAFKRVFGTATRQKRQPNMSLITFCVPVRCTTTLLATTFTGNHREKRTKEIATARFLTARVMSAAIMAGPKVCTHSIYSSRIHMRY